MKTKKHSKLKKEPETGSINLIGIGTEIKGDLICKGDVRIDGTVYGDVRAKGKLIIGTTGNVDGELFCKSAEIYGIVKGSITVGEILFLKSTARILGDISCTKLIVESGAEFIGFCQTGGLYPENNHYGNEQESEKIKTF